SASSCCRCRKHTYSRIITTSHSHPHLHSFPTRRSSDLIIEAGAQDAFVAVANKAVRIAGSIQHRKEMRGQLASVFDGKVLLVVRSEEHTSELQSQSNLVCRLLLEKKNDQRMGWPLQGSF